MQITQVMMSYTQLNFDQIWWKWYFKNECECFTEVSKHEKTAPWQAAREPKFSILDPGSMLKKYDLQRVQNLKEKLRTWIVFP